MAQCTNGTGSSPAPQDLRVDIAPGTTGLLLVSWNAPKNGPYTYNLCRSTTKNGPAGTYSLVNYCSESGGNPQYSTDTPTGPIVLCRDDNGVLAGGSSALTPGKTYYYEVQSCSSTGTGCGPFNSINSPQSTSFYSNAPITCTNCNIPGMQGFLNSKTQIVSLGTPPSYTVSTSTLIPPPLDAYPYPCVINSPSCATVNHSYSYHNPGPSWGHPIQPQNKLAVSLPGSDGLCSRGNFLWVAQNVGYDVLCVNYDDKSEQESICPGSAFTGPTQQIEGDVAACFTAISQAKLNFHPVTLTVNGVPTTIDCTKYNGQNATLCGQDKSGNAYTNKMDNLNNNFYVYSQYDAVVPRLTMMLYWLWCNAQVSSNGMYSTYWQTYLLNHGATISTTTACPNNAQTASILTNYSPNWSSIILSGFSQGGDMSTFADYYFATSSPPSFVDRVVNLSAPPAAAAVSDVVVPASYLSSIPVGIIPSINGLVSANDSHYCVGDKGLDNASIYQANWVAMGFTAANHDGEYDLNYNSANPVFCTTSPTVPPNSQSSFSSGSTSHNFVDWAPINQPGNTGHTDPLFIWNEDVYEFMLID
jgi:hypothetical protein